MTKRSVLQLSEECQGAIQRARSLFCASDSPFAEVSCSDDEIVYLALTTWIAELDRERLATSIFEETEAVAC